MGKRISKETREFQIREICKNRDYLFLGWVAGYIGLSSKIIVANTETNNVWEPILHKFLTLKPDPSEGIINKTLLKVKESTKVNRYSNIKRVGCTLDKHMLFSFYCNSCKVEGVVSSYSLRKDILRCDCKESPRPKLLYNKGVKDLVTSCDYCPYYVKWGGMIRRCFSDNPNDLAKFPSYVNTTVCESWLYFSNFYYWCKEQEHFYGISVADFNLDKDLKSLKTKGSLYSPKYCTFVSPAVNSFLTDSLSARGEQPLGVYLRKGKYIAQCKDPFNRQSNGKTAYLHLGSFNSAEEAHLVWAKCKYNFAKRLTACLKNNPKNILGNFLVDTYKIILEEAKYNVESNSPKWKNA